jgi:hypothetical protein
MSLSDLNEKRGAKTELKMTHKCLSIKRMRAHALFLKLHSSSCHIFPVVLIIIAVNSNNEEKKWKLDLLIWIYRMSQEKRPIFCGVIVSVILSKKVYIYIYIYIYTCVLFRTVSELELFHCTVHCTLYRRATRHVLTRVAKCIDVDGGIFENVLY